MLNDLAKAMKAFDGKKIAVLFCVGFWFVLLLFLYSFALER